MTLTGYVDPSAIAAGAGSVSPWTARADRIASWRPRSPRRLVVVLLIVFVASRLLAGALADHPMAYGDPQVDPGNDVNTFADVARRALDEGERPYRDQGISHPPGALAVIDSPHVLAPTLGVTYRTAFIGVMVLVDAFGALLLALLARRTGHWHGLVAWVLVVPLLGPVVYTRFDLLPAVLTIAALERASAGRWRAAGAFLGASAFTKVYAVFLLPHAWVVSPRRRQVVIGAALGAAITMAAFVTEFGDLVRSLIADQGQRGLHWESTWGSLVLTARAFGYPATIVTQYGAVDIASGVSRALTLTASVVSLAVVVLTARRCAESVRRGSAPGLAMAMFGTLALLLGLGSVYSPQYVLWVVALGAAALTLAPRRALPAGTALLAVVVLSHLVYPVLWRGLAEGAPLSLAVLLVRNGLTIAVGALALRELARTDPPLPASSERTATAGVPS